MSKTSLPQKGGSYTQTTKGGLKKVAGTQPATVSTPAGEPVLVADKEPAQNDD